MEFSKRQVEAQPVLCIRTTAAMSEMSTVLGPLFGEVFGHIQQSGQAPAGMPFTRYLHMDGDQLEIECGLPVAAPLDGAGRVRAGELPAGTVATVSHFGPYENLGQTWQALTKWIKSEGLEEAAPPWEVYVTDPGAEPDQAKWRTDIFFPVC